MERKRRRIKRSKEGQESDDNQWRTGYENQGNNFVPNRFLWTTHSTSVLWLTLESCCPQTWLKIYWLCCDELRTDVQIQGELMSLFLFRVIVFLSFFFFFQATHFPCCTSLQPVTSPFLVFIHHTSHTHQYWVTHTRQSLVKITLFNLSLLTSRPTHVESQTQFSQNHYPITTSLSLRPHTLSQKRRSRISVRE